MKIFLDSVGCRLNISEIEQTARLMQVAGWDIVFSPEEADLILINTCSVTAKAGADSRQKIRQANRRSNAPIMVTGCWSTLSPEDAAELPGVAAVIPNRDKDSLVEHLLQASRPTTADVQTWLQANQPARLRTRSFVKVQDGCNNRCAYCVTTLARGASRSMPIESILADIHAAEREGVQEVVLSGVHLGMWGRDLSPDENLTTLLRRLLARTAVPRIHLSSLEPWEIPEGLFDLWENPRLVRHVHMPLQSGSADTLRRMGRQVTPSRFEQLAADIRARIPGLALTTDLIAGFPGETASHHRESVAFLRRLDFAGGHVFPYSERPGTAAASLPNPVHHAERKARAAELRKVIVDSSRSFREAFTGTVQSVLIIQSKHGRLQGLTPNEIRVYTDGPEHLVNTIQRVELRVQVKSGFEGPILPPIENSRA